MMKKKYLVVLLKSPTEKWTEFIKDRGNTLELEWEDIADIVDYNITKKVKLVKEYTEKKDKKKLEKERKSAKVLFSYPPNAKNAITLTKQDLVRLNPDKLLNDTVIDFYLRYFKEQLLKPSKAKKFYLFNSFFYASLEKDTIRNWTKDDDIFNYKFIIVPINEHHHWKLAIIANAGIVPPMRPNPRDIRDSTSILLFDSLGLEDDSSEIFKKLKSYLESEWLAKKEQKRLFNGLNTKEYVPKVPCQVNFTDCGVFIIKYVVKFCECLPIDFSSVGTVQDKFGKNWFNVDEIQSLRLEMKEIINQLSKKAKDKNETQITTNET